MKEDIDKLFFIVKGSIIADQIRSLGIETPDNKLKEIYSEYEKWLSKEDRDKLGSLLSLLPDTKQEVLEILHKDAEMWTTFDTFQEEDKLVAETIELHDHEKTNIRNFEEYIEDESNRSLFQKLTRLLRLPKKRKRQ